MSSNDETLFLQENVANTLMRNSSTRQVLSSMGFPDQRALKAIVATGDAGVQVACDWIFAHVNDPNLNEKSTREYILYACPTGPLRLELDEFWHKSLQKCGRNGIHNSFPHITLCNFFKCEDENVASLLHSLTRACKRVLNLNMSTQIDVEYFSTQNYIGFFLQENSAKLLWKLSEFFAEEAKITANTDVEAHSNKQLHVTLAYKFLPTHFNSLEILAKQIDVSKSSLWEIRLYSRDSLFNGFETLRVIYPLTSRNEDHLQLINGDFIYVRPDSQVQESRSSEGWYQGTSWMTGCSGIFPVSHTEVAVDTDTWTVHKKFMLVSNGAAGKSGNKLTRKYSRGADEFHCSSQNLSFPEIERLEEGVNTLAVKTVPKNEEDEVKTEEKAHASNEEVYAKVMKPRGLRAHIRKVDPSNPRRIYIFRHAERVDVTFSKRWIDVCFDSQGNYFRQDINMPVRIPKRAGSPHAFTNDSPITRMGEHQALLSGEAMREIGIKVEHVYSSPSLRCIQTTNAILEGLGLQKTLEINLELGLFEWMKWCHGILPKFVEWESLTNFGINVSKTYKSLVKSNDLKSDERSDKYFQRSFKLMSHLLKETTGDILIVGHAASLDVLTRQIQGFNPRPMAEFVRFVTKVPYCASVVLEQCPGSGLTCQLIKPPYSRLTHSPNPVFDWQQLLKSS